MSKFIAFLLFCSFFLQSAYANPDCELLLLTPQQQSAAFYRELDSVTQSSPRFKRMYLKIRGRLWRSRILKECGKAGGCTNAQIAHAVKEALAKSSSSSNALGYGFLVGGMIANAATSAGITVWVNPQAEFFSTFVGFTLGQATFIGASLLSPFSEPISAKMRRFSFALKGKGQRDPAREPSSELEAKADAIHATYTLREQYATDRIFLFRNTLRLNFQTAALAVESGDRAAVVAELADAAMAGYRYFKDIDPREPAITNSIHASFLMKVETPSLLKEPTLALIRAREAHMDSNAEIYYKRALDVWLVDSR